MKSRRRKGCAIGAVSNLYFEAPHALFRGLARDAVHGRRVYRGPCAPGKQGAEQEGRQSVNESEHPLSLSDARRARKGVRAVRAGPRHGGRWGAAMLGGAK